MDANIKPIGFFRGVRNIFVCTSILTLALIDCTAALAQTAAPTANPDSYDVTQDSTLNVPAPGVLGNDKKVTGREGRNRSDLTAVLVGNVSHGNLNLSSDGSFTYTPSAGYTGADSFSYQAFDGVASSNTAVVSLTVSEGSGSSSSTAPVANPDSYSVDKNALLSVDSPGVLGNDDKSSLKGREAKGRSALRADLVGTVSHGNLSLSSDGSFAYSPAANYTGADSFTYRAYDGVEYSEPATVALTVNVVNSPPTISGLPGSVALPGEPYVFVPYADDIDGDVLVFSITGAPGWLNFDSNTGGISGTPGTGDIGVYPGISIGVTDGEFTAWLGEFEIDVAAESDSSFTLSWTPPLFNDDDSPLTDLQGHKIYYWAGNPEDATVIDVDQPGITSYFLSGFAPGLWKLAMTAYNSSGEESEQSVILPVFVR